MNDPNPTAKLAGNPGVGSSEIVRRRRSQGELINGLKQFMAGETYRTLDAIEQSRLNRVLDAMTRKARHAGLKPPTKLSDRRRNETRDI
jgi:hypothetical protein